MLGVLGGMGPAATIDFMAKVVALIDAARDQDHIPMVVTSIPQIPDRTSAILHNGEDPLPAMLRCVDVLEGAGASMIAIPCNTAHFWYPQIADYAHIPVLNIVEACAQELRSRQSGALRVGLMATAGTLASGIYQKRLTEFEIRLPADQGVVMQGIAAVKAGDLEGARLLLERVADDLFRDRCDAIIMACTEIPLALAERAKRAPSQYIDPTNALAKMSVSRWNERAEYATKREDKEQYARA
ncbi:MAG: aspartate/glutamate racemase family protein [Variibacter sp.]